MSRKREKTISKSGMATEAGFLMVFAESAISAISRRRTFSTRKWLSGKRIEAIAPHELKRVSGAQSFPASAAVNRSDWVRNEKNVFDVCKIELTRFH
jgi:hypothetical protein